MRAPLFIRVLTQPRQAFIDLAELRKGYGDLLWMLAVEMLLLEPMGVAPHLGRLIGDPINGLLGLLSMFGHFAITPLLIVFALGVVLHIALRGKPQKLDTWTASSVLAYAWMPHLVVTAVATIIAALGYAPAWLPNRPLSGPLDALGFVRLVIAFAPSAALAVVAVQAVATRTPKPEKAPPPESLPFAALGARGVVASALLLLLVAGGVTGNGFKIARNWDRLRPVVPNDPMPSFSLHALDGSALSSSQVQGQVMLIEFWATWCPNCVASMPGMIELHRELEGQGMRLLSVNTEPDNLPAVQSFTKEKGLPFPVYVDNGRMQQQFRVQAFPTFFVVDRQGVVRDVFVGSTSNSTLRNSVTELLAQ